MEGRSKRRGGRKKGACREEEKTAEGSVGEDGSNGLPMANVVRLMRQVLPPNVKIAASAKQLTHDCAVEFIGFVGGEASDRARAEHRRTIAPEDFTWSFRSLGFDSYVDPMKTYLRGYREYEGAGGSRGAPAPPQAAVMAPACPGGPSFTNEEVQFLKSIIPPPKDGYNGAASSSAQAPPPAAHGYGYGYTRHM